jgi:hypothetical protein
MQKVVGSNPISRFEKAPLRRGFLMGALAVIRSMSRPWKRFGSARRAVAYAPSQCGSTH